MKFLGIFFGTWIFGILFLPMWIGFGGFVMGDGFIATFKEIGTSGGMLVWAFIMFFLAAGMTADEYNFEKGPRYMIFNIKL